MRVMLWVPTADRRPFELGAVLDQPFEIDRLQDILFVIESFEQLAEGFEAWALGRGLF